MAPTWKKRRIAAEAAPKKVEAPAPVKKVATPAPAAVAEVEVAPKTVTKKRASKRTKKV